MKFTLPAASKITLENATAYTVALLAENDYPNVEIKGAEMLDEGHLEERVSVKFRFQGSARIWTCEAWIEDGQIYGEW